MSSNFVNVSKLNENAILQIFLLQSFEVKHARKKWMLHHPENSHENKDGILMQSSYGKSSNDILTLHGLLRKDKMAS